MKPCFERDEKLFCFTGAVKKFIRGVGLLFSTLKHLTPDDTAAFVPREWETIFVFHKENGEMNSGWKKKLLKGEYNIETLVGKIKLI